MATRQEIIKSARKFLDWGWGHQRRGPAHIDCVGLPIMVARDLGIKPPDFDITGYSRTADLPKLVARFRVLMPEKSRLAHRPGDLVVVRDTVFPCHCGILGEKSYGLSLIHARASVGRPVAGGGLHARGKVREEPYQTEWWPRTTHCFEFPGVTD